MAGAFTWWNLSGEVSREDFDAACIRAGISKTPSVPESKRLMRSLKIAAREVQKYIRGAYGSTSRVVVRPSSEREGVTLQWERGNEKGANEYQQLLRVWITDWEENPTLNFSLPTIQTPTEDVIQQAQKFIQDAWGHFGAVYTPEDMSSFLTKTLSDFQAVSLKKNGGSYFIPAPHHESFNDFTSVIEDASEHEFDVIYAHNATTRMRSVFRAIQEEAEKALTLTDEKLLGTNNRRGLNSRKEDLESLSSKLLNYERVLGMSLKDLKLKTKKLHRRVTRDLIAAED